MSGLGVPFRLLPYRHVISVWRDVIRVIERHVLATLLLFLLLLLLGLLLLGLLWHFGPVAAPAVVAQDQAEDHHGEDSGTAADNGGHRPDGEDHGLRRGAGAAHKATVVGCFADSSLRTLDTQTGHQGLTRPSCVELGADAGVTRVGIRHAAAVVLAGVRSAVAGGDTLVRVPLVDAHQAIPARTALTKVGTPAADLDRRAGLGQGDQAVFSGKRQVLPVVLHVGQAAVETCE